MNRRQAIGIFDSGMGGITVLAQVRRLLPCEDIIYWADSANCPYGPRSVEEITNLVESGTEQMLALGVKTIIIACNTATTVAIAHLRARYPHLPFIGLEPAVKPAVALSKSGRIVVLATRATLASSMFAQACERHAGQSTIIPIEGRGLAEIIEAAHENEAQTQQLVDELLRPAIESGADTIVLACTHYPLLMDTIRRVVAPSVEIIDPALAVARRTKQILEQHDILNDKKEAALTTYHSTAGQQAAHILEQRAAEYSKKISEQR